MINASKRGKAKTQSAVASVPQCVPTQLPQASGSREHPRWHLTGYRLFKPKAGHFQQPQYSYISYICLDYQVLMKSLIKTHKSQVKTNNTNVKSKKSKVKSQVKTNRSQVNS